MNVRPFSALDNVPSPSKKAPRLPASRLEELRGFEFLEEVNAFSEDQIGKLDSRRVSFVFNQLENLVNNPQTFSAAVRVSLRVIAATSVFWLREKKSLCKTIAQDIDPSRVNSIKVFVDHLFLTGNPLFKEFASLSFLHSYAQLYQAIKENSEIAIEALLSEPIDLSVEQDSSYVLFDMACLTQSYALLTLFLLKNAYATPNAYSHLLVNKKLTGSQKLSLFFELSKRKVNPDLEDDSGWTPFVYAIVNKEIRIVKFLLKHADLSRLIGGESYIEKAIKANFTEGALLLVRVSTPTREMFKLALDRGEIRLALEIAKSLRFKWENIPDFSVAVESVDPDLQQKARIAIRGRIADIYDMAIEEPAIFALSTLTSIRNQCAWHYLNFIKTVSHAWGISIDAVHPETKKPIDSGGNSPFKSLASWLAFLSEGKDSLPEAKELLEQFSEVLHHKMDPDAIEAADELLKKGKTVVCLTGFDLHTSYAIFKHDYALYANRGADCLNSGISVYQVPCTDDIIKSIRSLVFDKTLERGDYYTETNMLIDLDLEFICSLDLQKQKHPHCTINSLKAASLGAMVLDLIDEEKDFNEDWLTTLNKVKPAYKTLTTEYRLYILRGVFNEVEDVLKEKTLKSNTASLYYQILLALLTKIESGTRFDASKKKMYGNQIKAYLNRLVDHL